MVIKLHISKTDQLRKGDEVIIARSGGVTCPVTKLECYMQRTGMSWQDQRYLFRAICHSKAGEKLRESGSISYSCLREQFKKKLASLGCNHMEFGLHSLRAGGATKAANMGVPNRLFNGTATGNRKTPKMAMLMILLRGGSLSPSSWAYSAFTQLSL